MEESNLLKERLHAITEKHHIQEDIRQKKLELDQEKLKLQHLKKKALREQWLLQDSASHNAKDSPQKQSLLSDQQQTRALRLNIHRIELEVESLEREESVISTNESFILNRLKAVAKSSEDIIREAQDSFVPEPLHITTVIPDVPECLSPPANKQPEPNTSRKTLFAMEINVSKNLSTGESTVLSTATVPPDQLQQHPGLKVYDDGRKSIYALNSQEGSHDRRCVSELSVNEVEQLLQSATVHRHGHLQNQNHSRRDEYCFYNNHDVRDRVEVRPTSLQRGQSANQHLTNNDMQSYRKNWPRKPEVEHHYDPQYNCDRRQEERNNQSNLREGHHLGNYNGHHYGNQRDGYYSSGRVRNHVQEDRSVSCHANGLLSRNSAINGGRAKSCPLALSHDQEVVSTYQPQLCYTPANHIPLKDYVTVDEEELYCFSPPCYVSHDEHPPTAVYSTSAHSDRVPSPIYGDDIPYTILNTIETSEPITAIFMGFQTSQDDSGQGQEFEGSLKAELVIIDDSEDNKVTEKKSHTQPEGSSLPTGSAANGNRGSVEEDGNSWTERQEGPGTEE